MELITFQSQAYQDIVSKIDAIHQQLNANEKQPKEQWLDNQELMQLMKISKRTAQSWRDEGKISFSQVGNKIYYNLEDVEQLLKANYNKAFRK